MLDVTVESRLTSWNRGGDPPKPWMSQTFLSPHEQRRPDEIWERKINLDPEPKKPTAVFVHRSPFSPKPQRKQRGHQSRISSAAEPSPEPNLSPGRRAYRRRVRQTKQQQNEETETKTVWPPAPARARTRHRTPGENSDFDLDVREKVGEERESRFFCQNFYIFVIYFCWQDVT